MCNSDSLAGTSVYGSYVPGSSSSNTFSVAYNLIFNNNPSTEFLFMTGDKTVFLLTTWAQLSSTSSNPSLIAVKSTSLNPSNQNTYYLNTPIYSGGPILSLNNTALNTPVIYGSL